MTVTGSAWVALALVALYGAVVVVTVGVRGVLRALGTLSWFSARGGR